MRLRTALALVAASIIGLTMFNIYPVSAGGNPDHICPDGTTAMALGTQAAVDNPPLPPSPMQTIPAPQTHIAVKDGTLAVNGGEAFFDGQSIVATMYVCLAEDQPTRTSLQLQVVVANQRTDHYKSRYHWALATALGLGVLLVANIVVSIATNRSRSS